MAAAITKCATKDLHKPIAEQQHQPLAFLGSEFSKRQQNWSTFEKEAYEPFKAFEKLD